jgi:hypothetical protein
MPVTLPTSVKLERKPLLAHRKKDDSDGVMSLDIDIELGIPLSPYLWFGAPLYDSFTTSRLGWGYF